MPDYYTKDLELLDIIEEIAVDLFTGCLIREYSPIVTTEEVRWYQKYVCRKYPQK